MFLTLLVLLCTWIKLITILTLWIVSQIKAFTLPISYQTSTTTNNSYDIVYDLTTSSINTEILNLPLQNQLERTLKLSLSLGILAASNKVSSYTKLLTPFYKNSNNKKGKQVGDGEAGEGEEECWGIVSKLLNESVRGLSLIEGLNLIVIRPGIIYGGVTLEGSELLSLLLCVASGVER